MKIEHGKVEFGNSDMFFVKKFGIIEATNMVLDFCSTNKTPFIYDTFQLASFLGIHRATLFLITKHISSHYLNSRIPKRDGSFRELQIPDTLLRSMQYNILSSILNELKPSKYATAYKKGCNINSNAHPHVGKKYLLKMDISDFFGSIRFDQVYSAVFNTRLFPKQIGVMLTELCCYNDSLPQGAPTSPAISNLVMKQFDNNVGAWCEKNGISYTRYCDDMTFSSDEPLGKVYGKVKSMLDEMGFEINKRKTCFVTNHSRQSVTGLTVNEKISVSKDYKRNLRQALYYMFKYGLEGSVTRKKCPEFYDKNGLFMHQTYYNSLLGRVRYVLSVEPGNIEFRAALEKLTKYNFKT